MLFRNLKNEAMASVGSSTTGGEKKGHEADHSHSLS